MASDHTRSGPHQTGDHSNTSREADRLKPTAENEKRDAGKSIHEAASAAQQTASELGADVKDEAMRRAAEVQNQTSESLHAFAEAVRTAGDELAEKDQGTAATLVREAASGLEHFSTAFSKMRLHDVVDDVRNFGRQNPNAFVAGSVLVGLALGRFAQSSAPDNVDQGASGQHNASVAATDVPPAATAPATGSRTSSITKTSATDEATRRQGTGG